MDRRDLLKALGALGAFYPIAQSSLSFGNILNTELSAGDFGKDFKWGVATASYQIEGAVAEDGRTPSIWDTFSHKRGKIKDGQNGDIACDFYHRYESDIDIVKALNFNVFRFSLSWSRILPQGTGKANQKGIDFYNRIIDHCLKNDIEPWITLFHWDLPQILQDKGGWQNRDIIEWFGEYAELCANKFGDRVKNWMVLNEPVAFTVVGHLLGMHAPGKRGFNNMYPTVHHAAMCQSEGGRILKNNISNSNIGSTFSCSSIHPNSNKEKDVKAALKLDALINRLFIEPALGLGYPTDAWKLLKNIEKHIKSGDEKKLKFDFDFIGIQNYTRLLVKFSPLIPFIWGNQIDPEKRDVEITEMGWEVYPEGIYEMLKKFSEYENIPRIIITENGCAFPDNLEDGKVHDAKRISFYKEYLAQVLKAKKEGVNIDGYFCWTLMDNFEWAEGYHPRFGLVYVDFNSQKRIIKDSGYWFKEFLEK